MREREREREREIWKYVDDVAQRKRSNNKYYNSAFR